MWGCPVSHIKSNGVLFQQVPAATSRWPFGISSAPRPCRTARPAVNIGNVTRNRWAASIMAQTSTNRFANITTGKTLNNNRHVNCEERYKLNKRYIARCSRGGLPVVCFSYEIWHATSRNPPRSTSSVTRVSARGEHGREGPQQSPNHHSTTLFYYH